MSRMPRESDLRHGRDDELFGAAMVLCQDASGACAHNGRCSFDGICFQPTEIDYRRAHKLLKEMIDGMFHTESAGVRGYLIHALQGMEHYRRIETRKPDETAARARVG